MSEDILSKPAPPADSRLTYGPDPNQFVDLRFPTGDRTKKTLSPLVINIHGGYWRAAYNLDHAGHLCAALTMQGIATANLEYRRIGNEGGAWPGTFADIRSAYQFLVQHASAHNLDPAKIVVMGHSAGGQLALCLAAHEPSVARVVSLAGVVDLQRAYDLHLSHNAVVEFLGGTPKDVPEHYHEADPMQLKIQATQWLIHGASDDTVPSYLTRNYTQQKKGRSEDVHYLEISTASHIDLIDPHST